MVPEEASGLRHTLTLDLPSWISDMVVAVGPLPDVQARMGLVLELARANVERSTGGPFAAAVFDRDTGEVISVGVNLVVTTSVPVAHAEILAIALAGQRAGHHDLSAAGRTELVTSCEPCAMCLGAVPWSGVTRVVAGARDEDARAVGFDEGDKPGAWAQQLRARGIDVLVDIRRDEAAEVLRAYARAGGVIYNAPSARP